MGDDFFSVPRQAAQTSSGEVELPILYYDVTLVQAFFWCEMDRAERALENTGLRAARFVGGRALAGVAFFEYRDTSIGPYNEAGTALMVVPESAAAVRLPTLDLIRGGPKQSVGSYILDLPVTTRIAYDGGRELWGYPKFVTDIPVALSGARLECAVLEPGSGERLFSLEGARSWGPAIAAMDLVLYSHHHGELLKTAVDIKAKAVSGRGGDVELRVGDSQHRMANNLRALGLAGKRPFLVQTTEKFQSRLNAGQSIGTWQTPPLPYTDATGSDRQIV